MQERRQPIVAVLGHVDHGKTSLLDLIRSLGQERQASVMAREAGGITQHIGAAEVPAKLLNQLCATILGQKEFESPGLLFIDTPGHHSFTTLRSRGGALADIAILVIDIMEGCQPQTRESIRILKQAKTPFVVAANKIDRIHGWESERGRSSRAAFKDQRVEVQERFDERFWKLVGQFGEEGFNLDRYDRISDFTKEIALVPCSAKEGEGVQDLLAVTIGLAERFLSEQLEDVHGMAEGTVLEMKEERGLGKTLDLILSRGTLNKGDEIALATSTGALVTHVKGLFTPRGMSEMRDAGDRWDSIDSATAAAGLKVSARNLDNILAGTTLRVLPAGGEERDEVLAAVEQESRISIDLDEEGVVIRADTLGGLEALAFELKAIDVPIRHAGIGVVNKRDVRAAVAAGDPLHQAILAFSTGILTDAQTELEAESCEATHITSDVIYHIIERFQEWQEERKVDLEAQQRVDLVYPARILVLRDHIFRRSSPAVVGVRILGGRVHIGQRLLRLDGERLGQIKSMRSGDDSKRIAHQGDELAMAIQGPTVGRQFDEEDVLLVDIPASHVRRLRAADLTPMEEEILEEITALHRRQDRFWGL